MFKVGKSLILAGAVLYLLSSISLAQGGVKGKVRTNSGNGIANATITARQNGKDVTSVRSDSKGNFRLQGLDKGTYDIVFDAAGYAIGVKHGVAINDGNLRDLGDRLILTIDRGTLVILNGSVYFKEGTSLAGAKVEIERINSDGSTKKVGSGMTNYSGEFTYRQTSGPAKFRVTAKYRGVTGMKEIEVSGAAVYRLAITLDISRADK
ncbi:MAG: carboxypeptidase-like regulatory domain-containing protein [Pyrinomonadaceae bacterium]